MNNKRPLSVVVTSLLVGWAATSAQADVYVPPSLNPGDTYHLAFVTRDTRDALSSAIADYNAFV